ncbi:hypothetical protein JXB01_00580 [Candidatus Micrarchaeota archaeon]|nr:hypothetical protein [Candidatus Micrarchaeota archaeon]
MILSRGVAKIQRVNLKMWHTLKHTKTKKELCNFIRLNPELEPVIKSRLSKKRVKAIVEKEEIKDNCEYDFISEFIKSAVLRAGGTELMGWGIWKTGDFSEGIRSIPFGNGRETKIKIGTRTVILPLSHIIEIGKKDFASLALATERISSHISRKKVITRVDFVYENGKWVMVDAGESNTTLTTADSLFRFAGFQTDFLGLYLRSALKKYRQLNGSSPKRILMIPEDEEMMKNLYYEFESLEMRMYQMTSAEITTMVSSGFFEDTEKLDYDLGIRCFRILPEVVPAVKFPIIDPVEDAFKFRKSEFYKKLPKPPEGIIMPKFRIVKIGETAKTIDGIFGFIRQTGITDFVVKPAEKPKNHSVTAYFYNKDNEAHLRQMKKSIKKLSSAGVENLIVEEMCGSEAIEGKKLEIRIWNIN